MDAIAMNVNTAWLIQHGCVRAPLGILKFCVGDSNVDPLPILSNDPFEDIVGRSDHHYGRQCILPSRADSLTVEIHLPLSTFSSRGSDCIVP